MSFFIFVCNIITETFLSVSLLNIFAVDTNFAANGIFTLRSHYFRFTIEMSVSCLLSFAIRPLYRQDNLLICENQGVSAAM
jgi:hypothetical protein